MTRTELNALAQKVLRGDANLDGLGDAAAAAYLVAKVTGRSDVLQSDGYVEAALELLATQHGLRTDAAPAAPGRTPVYRVDADKRLDAEAVRADEAKKSEEAWRRPTVGTSFEDLFPRPTDRKDGADVGPKGASARDEKLEGLSLEALQARSARLREEHLRRLEGAWVDPQVKRAVAERADAIESRAAPEPSAGASLEQLQAAAEAQRQRVRADSERAWQTLPACASSSAA